MNKFPFVSILIVNYNGRHLLEECLSSLFSISYPRQAYEVILVDNNSFDDSVPFIHKNFPQVLVVKSEINLGFAGGNILGLEHAKGEYIVLLNSDVKVEKEWLSTLVAAANDKKVGIVSPRLRFAVPFVELTIDSLAVPRSKVFHTIDHSPIGALLEDITCDSAPLSNLVHYKNGFYEKRDGEISTRRTSGKALVLLPFDVQREVNTYIITIHGIESLDCERLPVTISVGTKMYEKISLQPHETVQIHLKLKKKQVHNQLKWLVQNAGNIIFSNGYSKDRGNVVIMHSQGAQEFYEEESPYFSQKTSLLAGCGASCLIKRAVIDQVGFLDKSYFMYYEDVEFSLRAWRAGWKIIYEPKSIGYHKHRATTGTDDSTFFLSHVERNHLAFVIEHFPLAVIFSEMQAFLLRFCESMIKVFVFQFMDNEARTQIWRVKFEGRKLAFQYIVLSFVRLYRERMNLDRQWPIDRKAMSEMTY